METASEGIRGGVTAFTVARNATARSSAARIARRKPASCCAGESSMETNDFV